MEQYTLAYQKVLERFTNIIIIYSAITIFLVPVTQDVFFEGPVHWIFYLNFGSFACFFSYSVTCAVRLIIPVELADLEIPKRYYQDYRLDYEEQNFSEETIVSLLKASYIDELETALTNNMQVTQKKSSFYYDALLYALISIVPFLICIGFHISKGEDGVPKVKLADSEILGNLPSNEFYEKAGR